MVTTALQSCCDVRSYVSHLYFKLSISLLVNLGFGSFLVLIFPSGLGFDRHTRRAESKARG